MKISVVIPAYNIENYIKRAIDSVLAQTRPADEIIIVDDGSTDATADKIKSYGNKVRYIYQKNKGLSGARNTGILEAKHDWIAFLDGDDEWLPEKLKLQSELAMRNPELSWVGGNFYSCQYRNGAALKPKMNDLQQAQARKEMENTDFFEEYFTAFGVGASGHPDTMVIRKDALVQVGLFCEDLVIFEDNDMWSRLAYLNFKYGFVFEAVAIYYLAVPQSLTQKHVDFCFVDDYMQRHLKLSREAGKLEEFQRCATGLISSRAHFLMSHAKGRQVRQLIQKYGDLLAPSFRMSCYVGSFCPIIWNYKEMIKKYIRSALRRN